VHVLEQVVERLVPFYGTGCPVAIVYRASWPDQSIVRGNLGDIVQRSSESPVDRTATILVGPVLGADDFRESALYSTDYQRRFRGRT
jgi:precorrin-4/cobalt-precorrin-4 C11-methyltransferase